MTQQAANTAITLEGREKPATGLAIVGTPDLLVAATPEDAAAYAEIGGVRRPTPRALADYWAALLQDYVALFVRGERPTRLLQLSSRGKTLLDIYGETLRRAGRGSGVPLSIVNPLTSSLAKSLRDMRSRVSSAKLSNTSASAIASRDAVGSSRISSWASRR